jgi:serpin B
MSGPTISRNLFRAVVIALSLSSALGCHRTPKGTPRRGDAPAASAEAGAGSAAAEAAKPAARSIKTAIEPHYVSPLELSDDVQDKFVRAHVTFAFNAFRRLVSAQPDANLVFSPASLQFALGMLVVGARGAGENRLARVTAPGVKPEHIYEVMQSWQEQLLRSMSTPVQPGVERVGVLKFANSMWLDDSVLPSSTFVEKSQKYFGFGVFRVPLRGAPGTALLDINQWVGDQTDGRIVRLVKGINPAETAILLSAAYFKTKFASPFGSTEPEPFVAKAGSKASVDMLRNVLRTRAVQTLSFQAVELDLLYGATSLIVAMPMAGPLESFARGLNAAKWSALLDDLERSKKTVDLHLPKSDLRSRFDDIHAALGLPAAPLALPFVSPGCQMAALSHEATFVANKEGIEVPSAAGTTMQSGAASPSKDDGSVVMRFDRPYLFAIVHRLTGAILYLGQVVSP